MSTNGLKDAGYEYVILDDCWSNGRYDNGSIRPDFTKFPNGMAYVADQIHDLDMKYGMYSDAGLYTCGQYGELSNDYAFETCTNQFGNSWLAGTRDY